MPNVVMFDAQLSTSQDAFRAVHSVRKRLSTSRPFSPRIMAHATAAFVASSSTAPVAETVSKIVEGLGH